MINLNLLDYKKLHIKVILSFLALICFFSTLNIVPSLDRDESRYIQSTVQMLETKDFVNINFLDNPRLKKPPGIYWLQAVSVTLTKNILFLDKAPLWAYRLPSAIGASIAVWLTFLIGQLLFGRKQGFIASLLLLSSPLLLMESHIAKTDSVLLAFFLYILYILAKIIFYDEKKLTKPSTITIFSAWVVLGFAFLIKGPVALFIIVFTIICFILCRESLDIKVMKPILGVLILLLIVTPWFVMIQSGNNSEVLFGSIKKDMILKLISAQESHGAPPGSYILSSFISAWPIALFIVPTTIWVFLNKSNKAVKFLLCSLIPTWICFEIIPTKLLHYILPLLPSFAILTSAMIISSFDKNKFNEIFLRPIYRLLSILPIIGGIILSFGVIYIGIKYGEGITLPIIFVATIYFSSAIKCGYFILYRNFIKALIIVIVSNIIAFNLLMFFVPNQLDKIWVSERVFKQIEYKTASDSFILLGYSEPSLVYRLGSLTEIVGSSEEAINLILDKNIRAIIIESSYLEQFKTLSKKNGIMLYKISKTILGFNYSKGKNVEIVIVDLN